MSDGAHGSGPGPGDAGDGFRRPSSAEQARTLVAAQTTGALATLTADGEPWASLVSFALTDDGGPVVCVSSLAEHGRNLAADGRASLLVHPPAVAGEDPLDAGRVTLAGTARQPSGDGARHARDVLLAAHPGAALYVDWADFTVWALKVERVRWVGGFARMDWVDAATYAAAAADPVAPAAAGALGHLNDDHADALLQIAQALGGTPDATAASCTAIDRYGLDLDVVVPDASQAVRVAFAPTVDAPDGLRQATVDLTRRARAVLADRGHSA